MMSGNKPIHVRDLPDQTGLPFPRAFLKCFRCGNESSADKGDYFMVRPDYVFKCCKVNMVLVVKETNYREVPAQ